MCKSWGIQRWWPMMVLFGVGCEQPSEVVSSSKLLQFHYEGKGNPLNDLHACWWSSKIIDPAPKFNWWILKGGSFHCPKIWEALQIAAASPECRWSWAQCGEVHNPQLQTFGHLLSELHLRFWWIWLFWLAFVDFFKYSLSLSLSCLDWDFDRWTGWAVSRDGSLEFSEN